MSDEEHLRDQLHQAAARPGDTDVGAFVHAGVRAARRRRLLTISATTVAIVAITAGGVALANRPGRGTPEAARPAHRTVSTPTDQGPELAPGQGPCATSRYTLRINGVPLSDRDAPLTLHARSTVDLQLVPAPGSAAIVSGNANMRLDTARAHNATARHVQESTTATVTGTLVGHTLRLTLPLTNHAKTALRPGPYVLAVSYTLNCPTVRNSGGGYELSVNLK